MKPLPSVQKDYRLSTGFSFCGPLSSLIQEKTESATPLKDCSQGEKDLHWMQEALRESISAMGVANPNPAVGCIIVDSQNQVVARGTTQTYRGHHAERMALEGILD